MNACVFYEPELSSNLEAEFLGCIFVKCIHFGENFEHNCPFFPPSWLYCFVFSLLVFFFFLLLILLMESLISLLTPFDLPSYFHFSRFSTELSSLEKKYSLIPVLDSNIFCDVSYFCVSPQLMLHNETKCKNKSSSCFSVD